ncbi:MAG: hypothetical protein ACREI9_08680 [Nitrospiraceae bacterium]
MALPTPAPTRRALYYPFHLCHEQTLTRLLEDYGSVHFRDYMALQLTPMSGTTAYQDRMGHYHPRLVETGQIVQGYSVSGPLDADAVSAVNRDLADQTWRTVFHDGLRDDRRFQRGLFDLSHSFAVAGSAVPGPAALLRLLEERRATQACSVELVQTLSRPRLAPDDGYAYEYALALVKTSAALVYTVRLCTQHGLGAVTDSEVHFHLLTRTCARKSLPLENRLVIRERY